MRTHIPGRAFGLGSILLLLAAITAAQEISNIELDVIFPREETYTQSEIFPIAVAVQNLPDDPSLGNASIQYAIMPYSENITSSEDSLEGALLTLLDGDGTDDYQIYVDNCNVTDRLVKQGHLNNLTLQFRISWPDGGGRYGFHDSSRLFGSDLRFGIETSPTGGEAIEPDVMEVPECPNFGVVVEIRPNATDESSAGFSEGSNAEDGNPCAIVVDDALKTLIVEAAESLAALRKDPLGTLDEDRDDDDDATTGLQTPPRAALAAALLFGYFMIRI